MTLDSGPFARGFVLLDCTTAPVEQFAGWFKAYPKLMLILFQCKSRRAVQAQLAVPYRHRILFTSAPLSKINLMAGIGRFRFGMTQQPDDFVKGNDRSRFQIASYSSFSTGLDYGTKPDIVAPGRLMNTFFNGNHITQASGTSFAAPYFAGILACFVQYYKAKHGVKRLSPDDVAKIRRLMLTSANPDRVVISKNDLRVPSPFEQGNGLVDLRRAIQFDELGVDIDSALNLPPIHVSQLMPDTSVPLGREQGFIPGFTYTFHPSRSFTLEGGSKKVKQEDGIAVFSHDGSGKNQQYSLNLAPLQVLLKDPRVQVAFYSGYIKVSPPAGDKLAEARVRYGGVVYRHPFSVFIPNAPVHPGDVQSVSLEAANVKFVLAAFRAYGKVHVYLVQQSNAPVVVGRMFTMENPYDPPRSTGQFQVALWNKKMLKCTKDCAYDESRACPKEDEQASDFAPVPGVTYVIKLYIRKSTGGHYWYEKEAGLPIRFVQ